MKYLSRWWGVGLYAGIVLVGTWMFLTGRLFADRPSLEERIGNNYLVVTRRDPSIRIGKSYAVEVEWIDGFKRVIYVRFVDVNKE